jgi:hypothetical protein
MVRIDEAYVAGGTTSRDAVVGTVVRGRVPISAMSARLVI